MNKIKMFLANMTFGKIRGDCTGICSLSLPCMWPTDDTLELKRAVVALAKNRNLSAVSTSRLERRFQKGANGSPCFSMRLN